jgi:hypothetical protein
MTLGWHREKKKDPGDTQLPFPHLCGGLEKWQWACKWAKDPSHSSSRSQTHCSRYSEQGRTMWQSHGQFRGFQLVLWGVVMTSVVWGGEMTFSEMMYVRKVSWCWMFSSTYRDFSWQESLGFDQYFKWQKGKLTSPFFSPLVLGLEPRAVVDTPNPWFLEAGSHYVAQAGQEFSTLLLQPPECCRHSRFTPLTTPFQWKFWLSHKSRKDGIMNPALIIINVLFLGFCQGGGVGPLFNELFWRKPQSS